MESVGNQETYAEEGAYTAFQPQGMVYHLDPQPQFIPYSYYNMPPLILPRIYMLPPPYPSYYIPQQHTNYLPVSNPDTCVQNFGVTANSSLMPQEGFISLDVQHGVHVDMTIDGGLKVYNTQMGIAIAINAYGNKCGLLHPSGLVRQCYNNVDIVTWDSKSSQRFAKICGSGVQFANRESSYSIDEAGIKSINSRNFCDLTGFGFIEQIFLNDSKIGSKYYGKCQRIVDTGKYEVMENGNCKWILNGVCIVSTIDEVKIYCKRGSLKLRISADGRVFVDTPLVYYTASNGTAKHLFVSKGQKKVYSRCGVLEVQYGHNSAGFVDKCDKLTIF